MTIGKGGRRAAKVQKEFGVRLYTKSREHPESPLVVEGSPSSAEKAVASIDRHVAERRRLNEERCRQEELRGTLPVCVEPGRIGKAIGKGGFRIRHVAKRYSGTMQLPERNKPDAQILVTGLEENARAAVAELELMANLILSHEHVLVPIRIKRKEHILMLGPESCRTAKIEWDLGVRFVRPTVNLPLILEGDVEELVTSRRLAYVRRF